MTIPIVPSVAPLTEADFLAVRLAEKRFLAIKRAAQVARLDAISLLAIAAVSLIITVISFGFWSAVVTVGLAVIGIVEIRSSQALRRTESAACRTLALNQLFLLALIIAYCLSQMISGNIPASIPGMYSAQDLDVWRQTFGIDLRKSIMLIYPLVIVGSIAFQGGLALYYYTRRRRVEAFVRETPAWIRRQLLELDR